MNGIFARTDEESIRRQTLLEHLQNTAEINSAFCRYFPTIGYLVGYAHDLGKACQAFQDRLFNNGARVDHSSAGAIFILNLVDEIDAKIDNPQLAYYMKTILNMIAFCVSCHHTGLRDMVVNADESELLIIKNKLLEENYKKQYNEIIAKGKYICDKIAEIIFGEVFKNECEKFFNYFINNVPEKLRGCNASYNKGISFFIGMYIRYFYSSLIDSDRIDAQQFDEKNNKNSIKTHKKEEKMQNFMQISQVLDKKIRSYPQNKLNKIRSEIYSECINKAQSNDRIFELKVQTGGGKTFSSFRFALEKIIQQDLDRVIYVVPYISIIEQNADEIRRLLATINCEDYLFESHSNAVNYKDNGEHKSGKYDNYFSSWDEPIIFTTMVGFLESVYGGSTQNNRRFHNLENSVLIFDEIQSLPVDCLGLFNLLINFLTSYLNCTVVLCTATQPTLSNLSQQCPTAQRQLEQFMEISNATPIITRSYPLLKRTQIEVCDEVMDIDRFREFVIEKYNLNGNVLVIVNTKRTASKMCLALRDYAPTYHLSTNMCAEHRLKVIEQVRHKLVDGEKFILVSTQLIEAGVDVDFRCVIRSRAGLESIIQSAGRCNREGKLVDEHGQPKLGRVYVVKLSKELENVSLVDDIASKQRIFDMANTVCKNSGYELTDDNIVDEYFRAIYAQYSTSHKKYPLQGNSSTALDCLCGIEHNIGRMDNPNTFKQHTEFANYQFGQVAKNFTVIQQNQIGVLMPYGKGAEYIDAIKNNRRIDMRDLQRYMVNIYIDKIKNFDSIGQGILYYEGEYDDNLGLTDEVIDLEFEGGVFN